MNLTHTCPPRGARSGASSRRDPTCPNRGRTPLLSTARVPFGIPEIDEMLEGGLVPHRPYLIVGPSGTGKTTLALQFLCEGIRRGEPGLYVTIEDPPNEVRFDHRALPPEIDRIDVFDAIPDVMRYEHIPFKDISSVRDVVPFQRVPSEIRKTPEFTSVEITVSALEQLLQDRGPAARLCPSRGRLPDRAAVLLHEGDRADVWRSGVPPVPLQPSYRPAC